MSSEESEPRLMGLKLLVAVETEVSDWLTVLIVTLKCPPWVTARLNRPVAGLFLTTTSQLHFRSPLTCVEPLLRLSWQSKLNSISATYFFAVVEKRDCNYLCSERFCVLISA